MAQYRDLHIRNRNPLSHRCPLQIKSSFHDGLDRRSTSRSRSRCRCYCFQCSYCLCRTFTPYHSPSTTPRAPDPAFHVTEEDLWLGNFADEILTGLPSWLRFPSLPSYMREPPRGNKSLMTINSFTRRL